MEKLSIVKAERIAAEDQMRDRNLVDLTQGIDAECAAGTLGLKAFVDTESQSVSQENVPSFVQCLLEKLLPRDPSDQQVLEVDTRPAPSGITNADGSITFSITVHSDLNLRSRNN